MAENARSWVYVAGAGRSGSMLLGGLLGRESGAFHGGELHVLWEALVGGWACECGAEVARCPVWSVVAAEVRQATGLRSLSSVAERARWLRGRHLGLGAPRPSAADVALRRATERAVERVTGATCLVDTSRTPATLAVAAALDRPLTVVHLVRDPRGVAFSDLAANGGPPPPERPPWPPRPMWRSTMAWLHANVAAERVLGQARRRGGLDRSVRLRYEDLVRDPGSALAAVVGSRPATGHLAGAGAGSSTGAGSGHALAGPPSRADRRPGGPDEAWRRTMTRRAQASAVVMTAPLFLRYGYGR